jgi:Putative DNA-binding domain
MSTQAVTQAEFAAALTDPNKAIPQGITSSRGTRDSKRFAVYRNNVYVGLIGVLAARYPVCAQLVGEAFFSALARAYVVEHKPSSPVMLGYGDMFPAFAAAFPGVQTVPYLPDVAALEREWSRAYNAADATPASVADLGAAARTGLDDLSLPPHPAAAIVTSHFPVGSIWSAHHTSSMTIPDRAEAVLIARPHMDVNVTVIPREDAVFAGHLFDGLTIGAAVDRTCSSFVEFEVGKALIGLCSLGAFRTLTPETHT